MIDRMLTTYSNLMVDISWVIWEDVITDEQGNVKPEWVTMIEKHCTRVTIGSDNVAQYFGIPNTKTNLLAMNIKKWGSLRTYTAHSSLSSLCGLTNLCRSFLTCISVRIGPHGDCISVRVGPHGDGASHHNHQTSRPDSKGSAPPQPTLL